MVYGVSVTALVAAQAVTPAPLPEWEWIQGGGACTISQAVAGSTAVLGITIYPGTDWTSVVLVDRDFSDGDVTALPDTRVTFQPGRSFVGDGSAYKSRSSRSRALKAFISGKDFLEALSKTGAVEVSQNSVAAMRLPIRSAEPAVQALLRCEDAKLQQWGFDVAFWRSLRAPPKPLKPLRQLFAPSDFPIEYILENFGDQIPVRLTVGSDGAVKDCVHLKLSDGRNRRTDVSEKRYDSFIIRRICGRLKNRGRFRPAIDQQGNFVSAPFITGPVFHIEW